MTTPQKIPSRASVNPALSGPFDAEFDIIVVGGGGGGLPAALFARWLGNSVGLLEKAAELGGTARKAAFWYWVPNNKKMRELGLVDGKADFLRYVTRLSCPQSQDHSASSEYGRLIVPPGTDAAHVIRGETWEELEREIAQRLQRYEPITGGFRLSADFSQNLKAAVARFNELARAGHDEDFHRGERPVEQLFNGTVREEPGRTNPTLYPVNEGGPYYAALVTGGTLDTKGGAKTTVNGQIVDDQDRPIPGLYGVGNCVASASGRAYWAGGATLGPIIAFAYRAAYAAHAEPVKDVDLIEELQVHH